MKSLQILFLLSILLIFKASAQQADNKKPMYGEVAKSEAHKQVDEKFVQATVASIGSKEEASEAFVKKAWAYFYHDSTDLAMQRFNQAWLLNPANPDVYFGFGALTEVKGNKAEADRFYKMGLAKDTAKVRTKTCLIHIANCREQLKDYKGAIDTYQRLISVLPDEDYSYERIGYLSAKLGNTDMALKAYTRAIKLDPGDVVIYNNRGYLYYTMKNYTAAIADYTTAIGFNPEYIEAYVNRGVARMDSGDLAGAKKDFEKCVELDPEAGELRRFLGVVKLKMKNKDGACLEFEIAKKLGDNEVEKLIGENCK